MLKRTLDAQGFQALAEPLRAFYRQEGDNYTLQVEGSPNPVPPAPAPVAPAPPVPPAPAPQGTATLEQVSAAVQKANELEAKLEKEIQARVKAEKVAVEGKVTAMMEAVGRKVGLLPGATRYMSSQALSDGFTLHESGEIRAMKGDNFVPSKNDPNLPMSPREWMLGLKKESPFLFSEPQGLGTPNGRPPSPGGKAPQSVIHESELTPQFVQANMSKILSGEVGVDTTTYN